PETKTLVGVGKGAIDWKKVFTAAKTGGVKNYFIEQNMEMTKEGVAYLKALNVSLRALIPRSRPGTNAAAGSPGSRATGPVRRRGAAGFPPRAKPGMESGVG